MQLRGGWCRNEFYKAACGISGLVCDNKIDYFFMKNTLYNVYFIDNESA